MSKIARTAGLLGLGIFSAATLQAATLPGFSLKAQTARFSFYVRGDQKVEADQSERYLARIEELLGHRFSGRAEYYRYSSPEEIAAGTGTYASGVTFAQARQIHSTKDFHAHEIVHLVAGQMGDPGAFFQEGLAVALGNEGKWNGKDVDSLAKSAARGARLSLLVAEFERMDPQKAYPLAGSFVARLIKSHGIAKVTEFFRACRASGGDRDAAFTRTFGQTLDEAGAVWAASL